MTLPIISLVDSIFFYKFCYVKNPSQTQARQEEEYRDGDAHGTEYQHLQSAFRYFPPKQSQHH